MTINEKIKKHLPLALLIILFIALLFFGNYFFAKKQSGGTDFLYRWLPTRLVLLENYQNPYSPEVEYQVELVHHGHAHVGDETPGIFAYPYYTMLVFLPFALIKNFTIARAAWMTFMALAHIAILLLTLDMIGDKPTKSVMLSLILFSLLSAEFTQALIDGNPSSLAALFAVLALFFISRNSDITAGIFLALSTIKPQLAILFFILVWLWAFFQHRRKIIYSSMATLGLFLGVSFLLQPNWFFEFIKDLRTYTNVAHPSTPRAILAYWMPASSANLIAWGLTILSTLTLLNIWKHSFQGDFFALLWAGSFTFAIMPLTGITSAKSNYVAMLPAVILLLQAGDKKIKKKDFWLSTFLLAWIFLSWVFFYAGRNWYVGERLIYFVDFYPLPILLFTLYYLVNPFKEREDFSEAEN